MKPPLNNAFHGQVDDQKFDFSINRIIVMSYTIWWLPQKERLPQKNWTLLPLTPIKDFSR